MNERHDQPATTRMLFMGEAALTDGFQLIGFETWADPPPEVIRRVFEELISSRRSAFVVVSQDLTEANHPVLKRIRSEGGRIIITEVPPLNDSDCFHSEIEQQVNLLLGQRRTN